MRTSGLLLLLLASAGAACTIHPEEYDIDAVVLSTRTSITKRMTRWIRTDPNWYLTRKTQNVLLFERIDRIDR